MAQSKIKRGFPWKKVTRVKLQVYRANNLARLFSNNENEIASTYIFYFLPQNLKAFYCSTKSYVRLLTYFTTLQLIFS